MTIAARRKKLTTVTSRTCIPGQSYSASQCRRQWRWEQAGGKDKQQWLQDVCSDTSPILGANVNGSDDESSQEEIVLRPHRVASKKPSSDAQESDSSSDEDCTIDMKPVKDAAGDETVDESDADRNSIY